MAKLPAQTNQKLEKIKSQKSPSSTFMWKDRENNFHSPCNMDTRHIFFTLRMIWNHTAPSHMKIEPFQRYSFSSYYTKDYMLQAVKVLSAELNSRHDLTPYFIKCLLIIKGHLNTLYGQKSIEE